MRTKPKTYNYKGIRITRRLVDGKNRFYTSPQVGPRKYFSSLPAAKRGIDRWEKLQYIKDKIRF